VATNRGRAGARVV